MTYVLDLHPVLAKLSSGYLIRSYELVTGKRDEGVKEKE